MICGIDLNIRALGIILRQARIDNGATLIDIARLTGVSKAQISRIERGEFNATLDTFSRIAIAAGMRPGNLLELALDCDHETLLKKVKKDQDLAADLKNGGWTSDPQRENVFLFCAHCVAGLAVLLWSSDPVDRAGKLLFPTHFRAGLLEAARKIKPMRDSTERANALIALDRNPYRELKRFGLFSLEMAKSYLKARDK